MACLISQLFPHHVCFCGPASQVGPSTNFRSRLHVKGPCQYHTMACAGGTRACRQRAAPSTRKQSHRGPTVRPVEVNNGSDFSPRCRALLPGVPRVRALDSSVALRRVERVVKGMLMAESSPKDKAVNGDAPTISEPKLASFCSHKLSALFTSTLGGFCLMDFADVISLAEAISLRGLDGRSRSTVTAGTTLLSVLAGSFFFSEVSLGLFLSTFCFCKSYDWPSAQDPVQRSTRMPRQSSSQHQRGAVPWQRAALVRLAEASAYLRRPAEPAVRRAAELQ
jgi:hypothetical protein